MSGVRIETVTSGPGLAALAPGWDELVRTMPRPSPFLLHAWVSAWWRHAASRGWRLEVHVAWREDRLAGILPLAGRRRCGLWATEFVGGHLSALADLMLARWEGEDTARALADHAARAPHDFLNVVGLPEDSRLVRALGPAVRIVARTEAPVLLLDGGWDAVYRERTSSKRRSLHRRRRRQLAGLGQLETTLARTPADVEHALDEAIHLHALRRRDLPDASGFSSAPRGGFQREALLSLAAQDITRILTTRLDGRAVAYHCYLAFAGTMYVHSLAFDPSFARWSPGLITTLDAIAAGADEGLGRVELLGGDERYKLELTDRLEPLQQAVGLARGVPGRLAVKAVIGATALRLRAKRQPALRRAYVKGLAPIRRLRSRPTGREAGQSTT